MILLEIGNTRWKAGQLQDSEVTFLQSGEGFDLLMTFLSAQKTKELTFASVASLELNAELTARLTQQGIQFREVVTTASAFGVENAYKEATRLGVDRWLTLIAARQLCNSAVAVIDAGTAITVDMMASNGKHLGGWIAPGFTTMQQSLLARSSRLSEGTDKPVQLLGTDTSEGLYLGCMAAMQGFVEQARLVAQQTLHEPFCYLFTGGDADKLELQSFGSFQHRPHLVLEGLAIAVMN